MDTLKCYEILEIQQEAPPEEIRKSYIRLAGIWRPDRYANSPLRDKAVEKMREIEDAYRHLAIFIPELKRSPSEVVKTEEPENHDSLVDDTTSHAQWTLIFFVVLLLGFAALVGYHVVKSEYKAASPSAADETVQP